MQRKFQAAILALTVASAGGIVGILHASDTTTSTVRANATPRSVLVELFTSEGCSDCPSADAVLAKLGAKESMPDINIIPMEEHVDYFNGKSWSDPFSQHALTLRQVQYMHAFRTSDVYTPQMVVQGRSQFLGSDAGQAKREIDLSGHDGTQFVPLTLTVRALSEKKIEISVKAPVANTSSRTQGGIFYAVTQDGLSSDVAGGENSGRKLNHTAVVRHMNRLTAYDSEVGVANASETVTLHSETDLRGLHVVAFAQREDTGAIVSAVQVNLKGLATEAVAAQR